MRPLLRPFLSRPLLSLDAEHLAAALRPPASRRVFDRALAAAAEQTDAGGDGAMMQGLLRAAAEPGGGQGEVQGEGVLPSELVPPSPEEEAVAGLLLQEREQRDRLRQDSLLQDSLRPETPRLGAMAEAEAEAEGVAGAGAEGSPDALPQPGGGGGGGGGGVGGGGRRSRRGRCGGGGGLKTILAPKSPLDDGADPSDLHIGAGGNAGCSSCRQGRLSLICVYRYGRPHHTAPELRDGSLDQTVGSTVYK